MVTSLTVSKSPEYVTLQSNLLLVQVIPHSDLLHWNDLSDATQKPFKIDIS